MNQQEMTADECMADAHYAAFTEALRGRKIQAMFALGSYYAMKKIGAEEAIDIYRKNGGDIHVSVDLALPFVTLTPVTLCQPRGLWQWNGRADVVWRPEEVSA